jgi:hypothetical protein
MREAAAGSIRRVGDAGRIEVSGVAARQGISVLGRFHA